jgi:hypothetical protein
MVSRANRRKKRTVFTLHVKRISMKWQYGADDAYTGTTIILLTLAILISLVMYSLFIPAGYDSGRTARAGMARITDLLVLNGDVTGYADLSGTLGTVRVNNTVPSPDKLGAVRVPVRLASVRLEWGEGTGANLGKATVLFTDPAGTKTLTGSSGPVLERSSWAIIRKGSILPGQTGNGNDLLEPNEVFVLFIYPHAPLAPKTPFTVEIRMPDQNPMKVTRVVPDPVTPVMDLE